MENAHNRPPRQVARLLVAAAPALLFCWGGYVRRWAGDDGFINLRVVRHLLAGHGFVYNLGERCEAVTSALWIFVLWLLAALGLDLESAAWVSALLLGTAGVFLSAWASAAAGEQEHDGEQAMSTWSLPFGMLAYAAIPVAWDYATSALENSLGLAYIGASYAVVVSAVRGRLSLPFAAALLLGLGPLVRPDFALYAGPLVLLLAATEATWRRRVALGLTSALPGLAYEIFRMGYFAAIVPNTAIAKEAFSARWDQGYLFLTNTTTSYALAVPLLCVLFELVPRAYARWRREARLLAAVPLVLALSGCLQIAYVVRVGGDFMHGRMLLPGLFAIFSSVAVVHVPRVRSMERVHTLLSAAVLAGWAGVCASSLRVEVFANDILDERRWYVDTSGSAHPVRTEDYEKHPYYAGPRFIRGLIAAGCSRGDASLTTGATDACVRVAVPDTLDGRLPEHPENGLFPLRTDGPADVVAVYGFRPLGLSGSAMGLRVHVVDSYGLADPLAARAELAARGRPGHEKTLSTVWFAAKHVAPEATREPNVALAAQALQCGLLAELARATREPLSPARFFTNMSLALPLHRLRVPVDPHEAVRRFCAYRQ
jgi:arabinofuranosyltransferase